MLLLFLTTIGVLSSAPLGDKPVGVGLGLFRRQIKPILAGKCLNCHDSEKKKAGLDLSRRARATNGGKSGPALLPGNPEASLVYQRISAGEMPPQNPLSPDQIMAFRQWVQAGAPYESEPLSSERKRAGPDWWSLKPIRSPKIPKV